MNTMRCRRVPAQALRRLRAPGLFVAAAAASLAAAAQSSPALDRFSLSLGAWHAEPRFGLDLDTWLARWNSGDLRPGRTSLPRLRADLLLGDRHGLSLDYFRYQRDYEAGFRSNDRIGPGTISTTGSARLDFELEYAKLSYRWWVGTGNTVFGLGAGAAHYRADVAAAGGAAINGVSGSFSESYRDSAFAPMLEVGLRHAISPDLRLFADLSGVRRGGGRSQGSIYNAAVGVEWFPTSRLGLTLDYGTTRIDLERKGSTQAGFRTRLQGPSAALKLRF